MTARYWAPAAWTGRQMTEGIEIVVDTAGTIQSIAVMPTPSSGATRLEGVVLPGHVNAHSHAFHRALRGHTHQQDDFWSWRELMYEIAGRIQPDTMEELATAVYGEMSLAGVTHVGEFHYLHHDVGGRSYSDPNAMSHALIRAARNAGLKLTLLSTCYLTADVDGSALTGVQERFTDGSVEAWLGRTHELASAYQDANDVNIGIAAHSVRAVPESALETIAQAKGDWPLHVHLSEQRRENEACLASLGRTPTQVLDDNGILGPTTTAIHAIHLTEADVGLLADSGTQVCICPTTERDLGDGLAPARELVEAGVSIALGSDSHATIDLLEEARAVELNDRARLERRGIHDPSALLQAAGSGGAKSLGSAGGELAVGQPGDFIAMRTDTPRLAGNADPASVLFAGVAADVSDVIVSGRRVVADGQHLALGSVTRRLREALDKVVVTA